MSINREIFRDSDIRGIYPKDLDEGVVYKIGQVLPQVLGVKKVAVGRDMRLSSPSLVAALTDGLLSRGVDVIELGLVSTPMVYFAAATLSVDLAVIVSSSHNPKEYNGLILAKKGALPTTSEELETILDMALSPTPLTQKERGEKSEMDILPRWIEHAMSFISIKKIRPLKVVFDGGNGVEVVELKPALEKLPQIKRVEMYLKPDGNFPNHIPNPLLSETLRDLRVRVVKEKADLGLAYDGDADRVFVIDEKGGIVHGSETAAFLAKYLLIRA